VLLLFILQAPGVMAVTVLHMQRPVYIVFACLVANRDLLFTLYTPPSVSICRADQRERALAILGLPKNAFTQVKTITKQPKLRAKPLSPHSASVPRSPSATSSHRVLTESDLDFGDPGSHGDGEPSRPAAALSPPPAASAQAQSSRSLFPPAHDAPAVDIGAGAGLPNWDLPAWVRAPAAHACGDCGG
jgi:hypothetical protein